MNPNRRTVKRKSIHILIRYFTLAEKVPIPRQSDNLTLKIRCRHPLQYQSSLLVTTGLTYGRPVAHLVHLHLPREVHACTSEKTVVMTLALLFLVVTMVVTTVMMAMVARTVMMAMVVITMLSVAIIAPALRHTSRNNVRVCTHRMVVSFAEN